MELTMQAVHEYLCMCGNQKNLDTKTLKAYRTDLRQFTGYLAGRDAAFDRAAVRDYTACMNRKFKPRTVKRKLASIRAFVTWLMDEQRLAQNPFENLHLKIQEPALLPRIIPLRVVEQMLSAAHQAMQRQPAGRALCETAVMEILFATGMRVSELSGLKAREIDLKDGVIRILGKGSKERILHITNAEVLAVLRQYAECGPSRDGTFFHSRDGGRLSEQSIRNIVRKYGELVNYPLRITPHMFRHTVATLLLEQDVDIRCIQQILGHASILTTQIYTHVAGAKQREIMETRHPRNGFSLNQSASAADYPQT